MPGRQHSLLNGEIYHVYNKSIDKREVFGEDAINEVAIETFTYYRSEEAIMRFSNYRKLPNPVKKIYESKVNKVKSFRISIIAYVLMPTHYHFLIRQNFDSGISVFLSQIQNSYTRYYNIVKQRNGPIFLDKFKSKPVNSEELLKHVSRYIHLNPYSAGIVSTISELEKYNWSSYSEYLSNSKLALCDKNILLSYFNNDVERLRKFVNDNREHQRTLEYCKYSKKW